ncbi:hypothetical protein EVA_11193 [gut metagenome]|uniref:Uncharacterized protein n=1 Tax=gut metagenome TaxID=749906 RepID=J9GLQ2_9ZZZZ
MAHCHNTSLFQINSTLRSYNGNGSTAFYIAGFANRNLHSQFNGICSRYLNLRCFTYRS